MLDRDSRIEELATSVFIAEHICTRDPLQLPPNGSATQARLLMMLHEIDQAPVAGSDGLRIVRRADLEGAAPDQATELFCIDTPAENWIERDASLQETLQRLASRGWLFVRSENSLLGTIGRQDLGRPTVSAYLFALILGVERGLRRLYGSYEGRPIPDEPTGHASGESEPYDKLDTFYTTIKAVRGCTRLVEDLGFIGAKKVKKALYEIKELRDHLAHARTVLGPDKSFADVMQRIRDLESLASRVRRLLADRQAVWQAYSKTEIICADDRSTVFSGSGFKGLSMPSPVFVISAQNPFEQYLGEEENLKRTLILEEYLRMHKEVTALKKVIGRSGDPSSDWEEESWAVSGLSRDGALEVCRLFHQRAIFELAEDRLSVISSDGVVY